MDIRVRIRTTDGADFELISNERSSVQSLQEAVSARLKLDPQLRYVRLIVSGKLLQPPSALLEDFKLATGCFIHAVVANKNDRSRAAAAAESDRSSSSSSGGNSSGGGSNGVLTAADIAALRGFDVLMRPGAGRNALDSDEVLSLRSYFRDDIDDFARTAAAADLQQQQPHESQQQFRVRLEAAWMAAQGPQSEFRLNLRARSLFGRSSSNDPQQQQQQLFSDLFSQLGGLRSGTATAGSLAINNNTAEDSDGTDADADAVEGRGWHLQQQSALATTATTTAVEVGSCRDFLYGVLMGFALGFMMIFCIWDRNVSHRQKLGILCGIMLQMFLSLAQRDALQQQQQQQQHDAVVADGVTIEAAAGDGSSSSGDEYETTIGFDRYGNKKSLHLSDLLLSSHISSSDSSSHSNGGSNSDGSISDSGGDEFSAAAAVAAAHLRGSRVLLLSVESSLMPLMQSLHQSKLSLLLPLQSMLQSLLLSLQYSMQQLATFFTVATAAKVFRGDALQ